MPVEFRNSIKGIEKCGVFDSMDFTLQGFITNKKVEVKKVIFNYPATIVIWDDNSKTVVKATEDEEYFDPRLGFLTAYYQKHCGMSKTKANKKLDEIENQFYEEWVE